MSLPPEPPEPESSDPARDAATLALLANGDPEGLRRLLGDHGGSVRSGLKRAFGRALNDHDIDDSIGLAVIRVWQSRTFDATKGTLRAWLFVIARNAAINLVAARRREPESLEQLGLLLPDLTHGTADAERLRLSIDVQNCLEAMPEQSRRILTADLAAGGVAATETLAARLGTSAGAIYVARSRGRRLLRKHLEKLGYTIENPRRQPHRPEPEPKPRFG